MNWYIPIPGKTRRTAYNANAPIYVPNPPTNLKAVAWHRRQKLLGHKKDRRVFPLLIPPVFEKATQISGHLGEIWDSAQEKLKYRFSCFGLGLFSAPHGLPCRNAICARCQALAVTASGSEFGQSCVRTGNRSMWSPLVSMVLSRISSDTSSRQRARVMYSANVHYAILSSFFAAPRGDPLPRKLRAIQRSRRSSLVCYSRSIALCMANW